MTPNSSGRVRIAVFTHPGRAKAAPDHPSASTAPRELEEGNEDAVAVDGWTSGEHMYVPVAGSFHLGKPLLFMVADGIGGVNSGEVASAMAVTHIAAESARMVDEAGVHAVVNEAHEAIRAAARDNPQHRGMGTTIAGVILTADQLIRFNVGDSRIYRHRDGFLEQISVDDVSLIERRRAEEEGRATNFINASLGGPEAVVDPHIGVQSLPAQGRWLLCTDGVSDPVGLETLEACMKPAPLETVLALYNVVMRAGGQDNLSIIVVDVRPPEGIRR